MPPLSNSNSSQTTTLQGETQNEITSPEMVKKISDMVYRRLMEELTFEEERVHFGSKSNVFGGW